MEDKRKEELKDKMNKIRSLEWKIDFYEKKLGDVIDTLEFLDIFHCHHISFTGKSDDGEYRENVPIQLHANNVEEVKELVKKKLRSQIEEYDDEILEAYQMLDELLK